MIVFSVIFKTLIVIAAIYGVIRILIERNTHEKEAAILWVLQRGDPAGMLALDVSQITGVFASQIYLYLDRLERRNLIRVTRDLRWPFRYRYHFLEESARQAMHVRDQAP